MHNYLINLIHFAISRVDKTLRIRLCGARYFIVALISIVLTLRLSAELFRTEIDLAVFIYFAREVLVHGKVLYVEILDINPPLMTWLMMASILPWKIINLDDRFITLVPVITIFILCASGLIITARFIRIFLPDVSRSHLFWFAVGVIIFGLLSQRYGERDQIVAFLIMPLVLLAGYYRATGSFQTDSDRIVPLILRLLASAFAAIGLMLKPHYILVMFLLEAWILFKFRRIAVIFRIENIAIAAIILLYVVAIFAFHPEYIQNGIPFAQKFYNSSFSVLRFHHELTFLVTVGIFVAISRRGLHVLCPKSVTVARLDALLVAAAGCYLSYLIQGRGIDYQRFPTHLLLFSWCLLALPGPFNDIKYARDSIVERMYYYYSHLLSTIICLALIFTIALVSIFSIATLAKNQYHIEHKLSEDAVANFFIKQGIAKEPVLVLSTSMAYHLPATLLLGNVVASRYIGLFGLPAELSLPADQQGEHAAALALDIDRYRPRFILVEGGRGRLSLSDDVDLISYFQRDPAFADAWKHYKLFDQHPVVQGSEDGRKLVVYRRLSTDSAEGPER
ncbi:MAG: hypothetical protein HC900_02050 [Methylacidiphilales bacterium]|nr:hypothetical protein [Candidatus Methylacidiphilales bacterium]